MNVVQKYSMSQLNGKKFDKDSNMLYQFAGQFIRAPKSLVQCGTKENMKLSTNDKSFVKGMYPKKK